MGEAKNRGTQQERVAAAVEEKRSAPLIIQPRGRRRISVIEAIFRAKLYAKWREEGKLTTEEPENEGEENV